MKRILLIALLSLSTSAYAGGKKHECHECKQGMPGPKGDKGDTGNPGRDGRDADSRSPMVNVGADVRWYDAKHYDVRSGYRYDTRNGAHTIDAVIFGIKIGKSYEQREIEKLAKTLIEHGRVIDDQSSLNGQIVSELGRLRDDVNGAKGSMLIIRGAK